MQREEDGALAFDLAGAALEDGFRSRQDAWYVQGVYQFMPRWRAGLRYDDLDAGSTRIGLVGSGALTLADFPSLAPATPSRVSLMVGLEPERVLAIARAVRLGRRARRRHGRAVAAAVHPCHRRARRAQVLGART